MTSPRPKAFCVNRPKLIGSALVTVQARHTHPRLSATRPRGAGACYRRSLRDSAQEAASMTGAVQDASGRERTVTETPATNPEALARIGRELQALYETLFSEPLPDHLTTLVQKLEDNAAEHPRPRLVAARNQAA